MALLLRLIINAVAIWLAAHWVHGISIQTDGHPDNVHKIGVLIGVAIVFSVVNALVRPIVKFFSIPLLILTLGLFTLIINALMLKLTAVLTESAKYGLRIEHFMPAVWGALIVSVVNWVLGIVVPERR
jgi:putative membrane protein